MILTFLDLVKVTHMFANYKTTAL